MSSVPVEVAQPRLSAEYKKTRWAGLASMAVAFISDGMEGGLINTLFPVIMDALALPLGALGVLSSISKYARMLFGTLWSMLADRFGRKKILILVTGIWGLWTIGVGFAQDYTQLLISLLHRGYCTVAGEPIATVYSGICLKMNERGKAYGAMRSVSSLGSLFFLPHDWPVGEHSGCLRIGMYIMAGTSS
jgi:MFS family permease